MKIDLFHKEIEIDENNKGIAHYFKIIGTPIDEVSTTYWYVLRKRNTDRDFNTEKGAQELRKMSETELKECVLDNLEACLKYYAHIDGDFSLHIKNK